MLRKSLAIWISAAAALALGVACGSSSGGSSSAGNSCINGASVACACANGATGAQICQGGSLGPCSCNGPGSDGGGPAADGGANSDGGSGEGGSPIVCSNDPTNDVCYCGPGGSGTGTPVSVCTATNVTPSGLCCASASYPSSGYCSCTGWGCTAPKSGVQTCYCGLVSTGLTQTSCEAPVGGHCCSGDGCACGTETCDNFPDAPNEVPSCTVSGAACPAPLKSVSQCAP